VYYRLGQYDKAVQDFRRCLRLYPQGTPALTASYFHLGRALVSVGQNNEAIDSLRKALELNGKVGGLSAEDTSEAQHLVEQLSSGGPYVSVITSGKQE
jgi:tetratricopeptide (TPR) repeat protein